MSEETRSPHTPFQAASSTPDLLAGQEEEDQPSDHHEATAQRSLSTTAYLRRKEYSRHNLESRLRARAEEARKALSGQKEPSAAARRGSGDMKRTKSEPQIADDDAALPKIRIGVCAMDKKARSRPMNAIVERMQAFGEFEIIVFGDDCILNKPVSEWPACECLLSWHSDGFPLAKAQKYAALRKPYLMNDLVMQNLLQDRRQVYATLKANGIPVPNHIIVNREHLPPGQRDPPGFVETEDYVELNGVQIGKPFVEKPADGEDHNIYIYYPHSMGGGVKRLYRKIDDKSGDYDAQHPGTVRRDGSYIIEEFLTTGGTDVKVYTVGPRYAHAEARKSPVVDGKVMRSADGKEIRYPVLLSPQEKEVARMVCLAFGQKVCGFDLLRNERGKSYVCDVNGWSFVKNSHKYYDDAAGILRSIILSAIAPHRLATAPPQLPAFPQQESGDAYGSCADLPSQESGNTTFRMYADTEDGIPERDCMEELRCVLAVIRHGDRTPKQKMKMRVTQAPMLELLARHLDAKGKQAKLKSPQELQELLDVTRQLLREHEAAAAAGQWSAEERAEAEETQEKFRIVKTVLEQGGSFAGINRKVQLKPTAWEEAGPPGERRVTEALLILKHGGVLTHAGRQQAEALGNVFRTVMYPLNGPAGGGLLRLHSTYRHDLKIYSSDEGRVQMSAAAFTQGLLDLEGASLTPILVSLVKKDAGMLDAFGKGASEDIQRAKGELYAQMTYNPATRCSEAADPGATPPLSPKHERHPLSPNGSLRPGFLDAAAASAAAATGAASGGSPVSRQLSDDGSSLDSAATARRSADLPRSRPAIHPMPRSPLRLLHRLVGLIKVLVEQLRKKCLEESVDKGRTPAKPYSVLNQAPAEWEVGAGHPCGGERLLLMFDRWRKLLKAFHNERKGVFDISKVPDIYDSAKYDAIHNGHLGLDLQELYGTAKELADSVIPNEYGIDADGKLKIGSKICSSLLGKILSDLQNMREESLATADIAGSSEPVSPFDAYEQVVTAGSAGTAISEAASAPGLLEGSLPSSSTGVAGAEDTAAEEGGGGGEGEEDAEPPLHRLCPTYAQDINSPLRHVRTRIYFTSESHVHSLVNVLRLCHQAGGREPLVSEAALQQLWETPELDYLTHVVFRMYENKRVGVDSPQRFRVEVLFSSGASHNPYEVLPIKRDHTLPVRPRTPLHQGSGMTWHDAQDLLAPLSTPFKSQQTFTPR